MSSLFATLKSFMPWTTTSQSSSQPSDPYSDPYSELSFSMIEIDGNLYYLSSMHIDQCILKFSHTMNLDLLDTFVKYATGLSNEKITTIVFKKSELTNGNEEKKVVGFWHPQLSRFVVQGTLSPTGDSVPRKPPGLRH
jgi:hypothetical protein